MRTEIAPLAAVCLALLELQLTLVAVGMELAKAFLVGLAAILAVFDDVVLVIRHIFFAVTVHISYLLTRKSWQLLQVVHVKIIVFAADGR